MHLGLTEQQVLEFKKIMEEEFKEEMTYAEASDCAYGFFELGYAIFQRDVDMNNASKDEQVA